jgi:hypothetical protein
LDSPLIHSAHKVKSLHKSKIEHLVEPGIFARLAPEITVHDEINPKKLVTWNRLDIGMRTTYLQLKSRLPSLANRIYYEDLKAQTLGLMVDPDNSEKDNWQVFREVFDDIAASIAKNGFDSGKTLLPLSSSGSILNGCHRLSAALVHDKDVSCVYTDLPPITCDHQYFFDRDVPTEIIECAARALMFYAENLYLAFLWPSGSEKLVQTESMFRNIIYKKRIWLARHGPFNLLYQCYHHMDWVGTAASGFPGLQQKQMECFPDGGGEVVVIAFQALGGLDEVRNLKARIRTANGIGFSSVHITDTKEEATRLSDLLFNQNGLHYLEYAEPITEHVRSVLMRLSEQAEEQDVDCDEFILDGSLLLELYGLRRADDLDVVASTISPDVYRKMGVDPREGELLFHGKTEDELVLDSANHFRLFGIKVIGFRQLRHMKRTRDQEKDRYDVKLMDCLIDERPWLAIQIRFRQKWLYARLRIRRWTIRSIGALLRSVRLYRPAQIVWRSLKNRREENAGSQK